MSLATVKAALVEALTVALATDKQVVVTYGTPGPTMVPDVIAVRDARAVVSGDEETFEIQTTISCYVGGGESAQATATARAYELLEAVRLAIYTDPTLDNACRSSALAVGHGYTETMAYDSTGQAVMGRLAEITATIGIWPDRPVIGSMANAHKFL